MATIEYRFACIACGHAVLTRSDSPLPARLLKLCFSCELGRNREQVNSRTYAARWRAKHGTKTDIPLCLCPTGDPKGHNHWAGSWPADGGRCRGCGTVNAVHVRGCLLPKKED